MIYQFEDVFKTIQYPSGEWHVIANDPLPWDGSVIVANVTDFNGLARCRVGDGILQRNRIDVDWVIPFFPFARDDRRNNRFDGMELKHATDFIQDLGAVMIDPHSEVVAQGLKFFPQDEVVMEYAYNGIFDGDPIIAIPDAGAAKKAYSWISEHNLPYVQCLKKRDAITGKLSGFQIIDNGLSFRYKDIIIIDDICDGGGTFLGLAAEFLSRTHPPNSLRLAVTHGLFTKGLEELTSQFAQIYTLDTCKLISDELIKVSLKNIIDRRNYR